MEEKIRVILRIIRNTIYRAVDLFTPSVTNRRYQTFKLFYLKGPSIVDRLRFLAPVQIYEKNLCEGIIDELKKSHDPIFIDVGANIGLVSLFVLNKLPKTKVYAFEPGLLQRSLLGLTVAKNDLESQISIHPQALSDVAGITEFTKYSGAIDGAGDGLVSTGRSNRELSMVPVQTLTLDEFVSQQDIKKIDVIKLDIEGAELLALRGAEKTLVKYKPVIYFELTPLNLTNYEHTAEETIRFLNDLRYEVKDSQNRICVPKNISEILQTEESFIAKQKN